MCNSIKNTQTLLYIYIYIYIYVCVCGGGWVFVCVVWFGLVSLFNGISTFVGYLMPKLFFQKNSSGTI